MAIITGNSSWPTFQPNSQARVTLASLTLDSQSISLQITVLRSLPGYFPLLLHLMVVDNVSFSAEHFALKIYASV